MEQHEVNIQALATTANEMVANGKGLLAIDESTGTCNKRFAQWGIPENPETRRQYRELIVDTSGLGESISGAILYDETIRQRKDDGSPFAKALADVGIIPGIKVDTGAKPMPAFSGEKITEGLDGLRERLAEYAQMGARFAKWRAVLVIGEGLPSQGCIEANAHAGAVCGTVPGSRSGPGRRAGSAHGRGAHIGNMRRSDRATTAYRVSRTLLAASETRRNDPETQHGAARIELSRAGECR